MAQESREAYDSNVGSRTGQSEMVVEKGDRDPEAKMMLAGHAPSVIPPAMSVVAVANAAVWPRREKRGDRGESREMVIMSSIYLFLPAHH